jgi:protein-disulfide isomerase
VAEYASVACPHCAAFNNDVFPAFKAKYIDTGKVHYVLHEMLVGGQAEEALAAAGFLLARCEGPAKYFDVVDEVFQYQAGMYVRGSSPGSVLDNIAKLDGMSDAAFQACLSNTANLNAFNARADRHRVADHVDLTPTFEVNGERLAPEATSLTDLANAIAHAAPRRG